MDIDSRVARNADAGDLGGGEVITDLLDRVGDGDCAAMDRLIPLVYADLRRIARQQRRGAGGHERTLNTTAVVHEAFLRLAGSGSGFEHRGHFFAVAATAMRQVLIDQAKRRLRDKRGGGVRPVNLDDHDIAVHDQAEFLVAIGQALDRLEELNPRLRKVVECRYFAGLSEVETAEALQITDRTVRRDWVKAKGWLTVELGLAPVALPGS